MTNFSFIDLVKAAPMPVIVKGALQFSTGTTVINNTSANSDQRHFSNLADGAVLGVGSNKF